MKLNILAAENVEQAPEIILYFWIESLGDFLFTMNRAVQKHGAKPEEVEQDCVNARADQQALVDLLKTRKGFEFADHAEYMKWYRWWNHWHRHVLTDEQWRELNKKLQWNGTQTEEDFAGWRPEGNWRDEKPCGG